MYLQYCTARRVVWIVYLFHARHKHICIKLLSVICADITNTTSPSQFNKINFAVESSHQTVQCNIAVKVLNTVCCWRGRSIDGEMSRTVHSFVHHQCIHPCMYPYMHPSVQISIRPYMYPSVHTCIHASIHAPMHPPTHPQTHRRTYIRPYIHPFIKKFGTHCKCRVQVRSQVRSQAKIEQILRRSCERALIPYMGETSLLMLVLYLWYLLCWWPSFRFVLLLVTDRQNSLTADCFIATAHSSWPLLIYVSAGCSLSDLTYRI